MTSFTRVKSMLCICAASGALSVSAAATAQSVATLGNVKVTADDVTQLANAQPQLKSQMLSSDKVLHDVVQQELVRRALLQEARSSGWDRRPDVAKAAEAAHDNVILGSYMNSVALVPKDYPDDAAVTAFYDANRAGLVLPRRYHLAQIFIARPTGKDAGAAAELRAQSIATKAGKPDADFAALAKAESADAASRDKGGDIGWFVEANIAPPIRAIVPQLQPGGVSRPVAIADGWHIVKLIELKPQAPATLEEARPVVTQKLRIERAAQLRQAYVNALLQKSPPQIDAAALKDLRSKLK